jgi:MoaA/NifB/PqqE/SkfB family radical SAM enzyme
MHDYKDIRSVHLEISTRCNAACPDCPRNFRGVDVIDDYPLTDMRLDQAQKIFTESFLKQLNRIYINGNYGDFVTAQDGLKIVEYFKSVNPALNIEISTNASAKPHIWAPLGELKTKVHFRIDGLKDTHHLYRQNTDFDLVISNAKEFIAAGGKAIWTLIPFKHNQHQIEQCWALAKELGFTRFLIQDAGRNTMPVFNKNKELTHVIGDYQGSVNFEELFTQYTQYKKKHDPMVLLKGLDIVDKKIECFSKKNKEIYISANGDVYPCCWLGFYPQHDPMSIRNFQLVPMINKNNSLEHSIEDTVKWFNKVEESWTKESVVGGKLYTCNTYCGK